MKVEFNSITSGSVTALLLIAGFVAAAVPTCSAQPTVIAQNISDFQNIALTSVQQRQVQQIRQETQVQILTILTPEQRTQLNTAIAADQKPQQALMTMDLSFEQKNKLKKVMQTQKQKAMAILTPQQKLQLRQNK
jgi:periplasmic protein CpxP/Spy